jgi:ribonuclease-3
VFALGWLIKLYNYFLSPDKDLCRRLRPLLGFVPVNLSIFILAFSHKSNSSDKDYALQNNERLEYLGDAVLGTIVAEYLFKKYPNADEGFLTKMRSKIVKRKSLNKIGEKMGLDLLLAEHNNTRLSKSMMGNAVEALVGAVYLERGYDRTRRFVIRRILRNYVDVHELETYDDNYKSQLLEWCQKNGQNVSYKLVARYKFEKRDRFKVAVLVDGKKMAVADDFNKKSAEQAASERAMQTLGILSTENEKP